MDTKELTRMRAAGAALEAAQAELATAREDAGRWREQLDAAQEEIEILRKQAGKMSRVEAEFAEVKQLIAEAKESIKRDLINEWAVTVAPHMKTTNREVQDLREQHEALKEKISGMLDDFTSRTTGTAQNITKRFAEQVNAAWTVVQDEQEKGKIALKRLHAVNETTLAKQQETINALLGRVARYDENAVALYKSLAELDAKNKQTAIKLDAAIERFDQMTSERLTSLTIAAQDTITATSNTAQKQMEQARRRYVKVLGGFDNRLMDHPLLLMLLLVTVVSIGGGAMGALAGARAVNMATETMIANSVAASTQIMEAKMNKVEEQTKDINQTIEDAQLWRAMTDGMYFQQKMDFIKQARQKAEQSRRSRGMPANMPAIDKVQ